MLRLWHRYSKFAIVSSYVVLVGAVLIMLIGPWPFLIVEIAAFAAIILLWGPCTLIQHVLWRRLANGECIVCGRHGLTLNSRGWWQCDFCGSRISPRLHVQRGDSQNG